MRFQLWGYKSMQSYVYVIKPYFFYMIKGILTIKYGMHTRYLDCCEVSGVGDCSRLVTIKIVFLQLEPSHQQNTTNGG